MRVLITTASGPALSIQYMLCVSIDHIGITYLILPLQVSAGQHMQLTGDLKPGVSVAAQQGMYFNQQQAQSQSGPTGQQTDTYCSVSQSQTINFTQQTIRQRAAAAAAGGVPQPGGGSAGARGHPQQVPPGQVDQHHAKLLQQQQIMRAQQVSLYYNPFIYSFSYKNVKYNYHTY